LSIILIQKNLNETFEKAKHKIDFAGIITLSIAMIIFMNIFITNNNISSGNIIAVVIVALLLFIFYRIERKAAEPIIPFNIFTKTGIIVNLISFFASAILIGCDVYLPIYMQNVLGFSAKVSGLALAPMSLSWLIASVILGKCAVKYGAKTTLLISNFILLISTMFMLALSVNSSILLVLIFAFIMGFGFGGAFTILTIIVQESVELNKRGAATASNSLVRTLGQTIGVSVFGSVFNLYIIKYIAHQGITGVNLSDLDKFTKNNNVINGEQVKLALCSSLHVLFIVFIIISIVSLLLSLVMPRIADWNRK
jgi:MFS family permease